MNKKYQTEAAYRMALEELVRNESRKTGEAIQRLRRRVAFDELLKRLFRTFSKNLMLKGGYGMEKRFENARATKDIDLVLKASTLSFPQNRDQFIREKLQDAAKKNGNEFFTFLIGPPVLDLEAVPYGGHRFMIEATLDNRVFEKFAIDVVVSSLFLEPIEEITYESTFDLVDSKPPVIFLISKEQQFAEKLHAYSLPLEENSRVKDLADMIVLLKKGNLDETLLKVAIKKVFDFRNTHPIPNGLINPPISWIAKYDQLRGECEIDLNLEKSLATLANYLKLPVLANKEKNHSVPAPSKCFFCQGKAISWIADFPKQGGAINEAELTADYDCEQCNSYRITDSFRSIGNLDYNLKYKEEWKGYLQSLPEELKKERIFISTSNHIPPSIN